MEGIYRAITLQCDSRSSYSAEKRRISRERDEILRNRERLSWSFRKYISLRSNLDRWFFVKISHCPDRQRFQRINCSFSEFKSILNVLFQRPIEKSLYFANYYFFGENTENIFIRRISLLNKLKFFYVFNAFCEIGWKRFENASLYSTCM